MKYPQGRGRVGNQQMPPELDSWGGKWNKNYYETDKNPTWTNNEKGSYFFFPGYFLFHRPA